MIAGMTEITLRFRADLRLEIEEGAVMHGARRPCYGKGETYITASSCSSSTQYFSLV